MYVGLKTFLDNMGAFENANANDNRVKKKTMSFQSIITLKALSYY